MPVCLLDKSYANAILYMRKVGSDESLLSRQNSFTLRIFPEKKEWHVSPIKIIVICPEKMEEKCLKIGHERVFLES